MVLNGGVRWQGSLFAMLFVLLSSVSAAPWSASMEGLVIAAGDSGLRHMVRRDTNLPKPMIKSLHVSSHVVHRYATTLMTSRVVNPADAAQEVEFSVILPDRAFITGFLMEIDGKVYKSSVKEKQEAQQVYDHAVSQGQAAAHVKQSARDSNRFSVAVNIQPVQKVTFNLTYEELLERKHGIYKHVINVNPGQTVDDMRIDVSITELRNITKVRVPELQSGNEIDPELQDKENPLADVEIISPTEVRVKFQPNVTEQKKYEERQKLKKKLKESGRESDGFIEEYYGQKPRELEGVSGQFVVEYDVVTDPSGGEVLVSDGYLVHFFSPKDLTPLKKHVIFVLDVSGSMMGRKEEQLKAAMKSILEELRPTDYFNIIEFSYSVTVRNLDTPAENMVFTPWRNNRESPIKEISTIPFPANETYIQKAKDTIQRMTVGGGTNIAAALQAAVRIARQGVPHSSPGIAETLAPVQAEPGDPQPMIIFLTDGEPTVGETRLSSILRVVDEDNRNPKVPIYSLAFGDGADTKFLKSLSLLNLAFMTPIYEAADASLQLQDYYKQVSSPLLSHVSFVYPKDKIEEDSITKTEFPTYFGGSEIVVVTKLLSDVSNVTVEAISAQGKRSYIIHDSDMIRLPPIPRTPERPFGPLERHWAYLTIKQLLDKHDAMQAYRESGMGGTERPETTGKPDKPEKPVLQPKDQALKLALKYSFVCPLTSLVVVKPNSSSSVDLESAKPADGGGPQPQGLYFSRPLSSFQPIPASAHRLGFGGNVYKASFVVPKFGHRSRSKSVFTGLPGPSPSNFQFQGLSAPLSPSIGSMMAPARARPAMEASLIVGGAMGGSSVNKMDVDAHDYAFYPTTPVYHPTTTWAHTTTHSILAEEEEEVSETTSESTTVATPALKSSTTPESTSESTTELKSSTTPESASTSTSDSTKSETTQLKSSTTPESTSASTSDSTKSETPELKSSTTPESTSESTTVATPTSSTSTEAIPEVSNDPLTRLRLNWLDTLRRNHTVTLNGTEYKLDLEEVDTPYDTCKVQEVTGHCRHLQHCIKTLESVPDSTTYLQQYFCTIPGNRVGICCPEPQPEVTGATSEPQTTVSS